MWILLFRAFPFTSATPLFKVGLLRYKKVRRQVAALFFRSAFCSASLRKNPNPIGLQSLTLWAKGLVSGLQVVPYAGAGPTLLFWMNTLTTCAVSFQKTEN